MLILLPFPTLISSVVLARGRGGESGIRSPFAAVAGSNNKGEALRIAFKQYRTHRCPDVSHQVLSALGERLEPEVSLPTLQATAVDLVLSEGSSSAALDRTLRYLQVSLCPTTGKCEGIVAYCPYSSRFSFSDLHQAASSRPVGEDITHSLLWEQINEEGVEYTSVVCFTAATVQCLLTTPKRLPLSDPHLQRSYKLTAPSPGHLGVYTAQLVLQVCVLELELGLDALAPP